MNDKQGDSLVAAIEGNFAGMSHGDLVLTCEMLTRGRAAWQKECEEAHAVLDDPECLIIRNEKDGYPEGRPDRTLTLAERVRALLRMKVDYKRWMTSAEQERDSLHSTVAELEKEVERWKQSYQSEAKRDGNWLDKWGACRVCGGEIPHGHTQTCDLHKEQMENRTLRSTVAELQKDKERLDWLQNNKQGVEMLAGEFRVYTGKQHSPSTDIRHVSLRQVIDTAMSAEKK